MTEGEMTEPEYPRNGAWQDPFHYGSGGFCVNDHRRETAISLRRRLFPGLMKRKRDVPMNQDDTSVDFEDWVEAQLEHYGIDFSPDIGPFKAKALLLTKVAYGECDAAPQRVLAIKSALKAEYEKMMDDYRAQLRAYHAQELPRRMRKFAACGTPTEEVQCDSSLFLRRFFLDEHGNPDRDKTTDPILLPGYTDRHMALAGRVERMPALHVAYGGLPGNSKGTVIGWNRAKISEVAHKVDMQQAVPSNLCPSSDLARQMDRHEEYVNNIDFKRDRPYELHSTTGLYAIGCKEIRYYCPNLSEKMCIRIVSGGRLAVFDLGKVCGLMILGKSLEEVSKIVEDGTWKADPVDEIDTESEDDEGASSDEEINNGQESSLGDDTDRSVSDDSGSPDYAMPQPPAKRWKGESSASRRLYFQWRGYNTMTGDIQCDPPDRNTGHLDFEDNQATCFDGKIHMEITGGETAFKGYRVPGLCGPLTMNWDALSHLDSDRAKVPDYVW